MSNNDVAIGEGLNLPVQPVKVEAASAHFGWFELFASMDVPASSARTRAALGWQPRHPLLLDDLRDAGYF